MEQGKYVTLVSSDGFEFVVLREAALRSKVIKSMLDPRSTFLSSLYHLRLAFLSPHCTLSIWSSSLMLTNTGGFQEAQTGICRFQEIR